jgi:hypothetical protein
MVVKRHPLVSFKLPLISDALKGTRRRFLIASGKIAQENNKDKLRMKKAQMKIQQTAFMLLAVTLFFVLAGMFVLVFRFAGLKDSNTDLEAENAMRLITKIANSPEFSCGESFGTQRTNCIDADKVMALKRKIKDYEDFWGKETNVEIIRIYPEKGDVVCNQGNYPNCDIINLQGEEIKSEYSNFVALCRKENLGGEAMDKCELAKIMVNYKQW